MVNIYTCTKNYVNICKLFKKKVQKTEDGLMDGQTDGGVKNIMPFATSMRGVQKW